MPAPAPGEDRSGPTIYETHVVARYPHDPTAYTQGLLWHDGAMYESTGRVGRSVIRRVDLETGGVLAQSPIPATHFGEGLAIWNDELISLTWRNGAVHRWSLADLSPVSSQDGFAFEGWGLTTSAEGLIFSDGTATLRVIDPVTYDVRRAIDVTLLGVPSSR